MRLELDDISIHASKNKDTTICHSEKMTQTDIEILGRDCFSYDKRFKTTPNGTSPCNHPSLSCQVGFTYQNINIILTMKRAVLKFLISIFSIYFIGITCLIYRIICNPNSPAIF